ncbi:AHH domain-containing protein [Marinicellulosiphila megalodicopiae]|uniref:AHH domain-containing protein n=1 Tax=Marinicellulosiphila megalodicopiae TaxID=2724896 RepID=UPI003BB1DD1C
MSGNINKDTNYRKNILEVIKKRDDYDDHPISHGIKMQAHHLISGDGVKDIANKNLVKASGYNINHENNVALIPSTFAGACHLGCQLHRGNHTSTVDILEHDDPDNEHPEQYHVTVEKLVLEVVDKLTSCVDLESEKKRVVKNLDAVSKVLAKMIHEFSKKAQLTQVYQSFKYEGLLKDIGCSGANYMGDHDEKKSCIHGRNHKEFTLKKTIQKDIK